MKYKQLSNILSKSFNQSDITYDLIDYLKGFNLSNQNLKAIADRINYFIYLDNHLKIYEIVGMADISTTTIYDFTQNQKREFANYYNSLKKPELAIKDEKKILNFNQSYLFTDSFYSGKLQEYINYLRFSYHTNLKAMFNHIIYDIPADKCDFFGYNTLIEILIKDKHFFKI